MMNALHRPLKARIAKKVTEAGAAVQAGDVDGAIFGLLGAFAAIGRDLAQHSWLKSPWSEIYPELPGQVEGVLRETFEDEHWRLEDPLGWAEMNDESSDGSGDAV